MADPKTIKNRIKAVGVELEGGWSHDQINRDIDLRIEHDGSVNFADIQVPKRLANYNLAGSTAEVKALKKELEEWRREHIPAQPGEIPSPPLGVDKVHDWMLKYYPKFVNATCGMHVHMSFFYNINYQRLMVPEFTDVMVKELVKWAETKKFPDKHPIWNRITQKDHPHCAHIYLGEQQSKATHKDYRSRGTDHSRYTALNYCYSMPTNHGPRRTVECRLLPMMENAELGIEAVQEVLNITNRFLAKIRSREAKLEGGVKRSSSTTFSRRLHV